MNGFGTRAIHGADGADGDVRSHGLPLYQTTSFTFPDVRAGVAAFEGSGDFLYSRQANPTVRALERHVAVLESVPVATPVGDRAPAGPVESRFFASGMAAITSTVLGLAAEGRVVCQGGIYGTTESTLAGLRRFGIDVVFAPVGDLDALAAAVASAETALVHVETPANPLLQVTDVEVAATIAHDAGARLAVDATFATPALSRPLAWGADVVLHSTTKFMAGHGIVLGGIVTGEAQLIAESIEPLRTTFGGCADPFAAWLTEMGLKTLDVRMVRHARNGETIASFLRRHPRVMRVYRPDVEALPAGQLAAGGPMLSFEVEGGADAALDLIDRLELITLTPTLGNIDTLVQHPWSMSHVVLSEERRLEMGIRPGIIRVSTGLEDAADLIADLGRALGDEG